MKALLIGLLFVSFLQICQNYRILGLFPIQGKSHIIMFERLMKELAERGHEVDVLSHFPQKKPIPRWEISNLFVLNFNVAIEKRRKKYEIKKQPVSVYYCIILNKSGTSFFFKLTSIIIIEGCCSFINLYVNSWFYFYKIIFKCKYTNTKYRYHVSLGKWNINFFQRQMIFE